MVVIVKQVSGLGNQLFQYAAGRYFARMFSADLRIITAHPKHALSHGTFARPLLLPRFTIKAPISEMTGLDKLLLSRRRPGHILSALITLLTRTHIAHEAFAKRYRFLPELLLPSGTSTLYLDGYWQACAYADAVVEDLRQEFRLKEAPTGHNLEMQNRIASASTPVSLHMRRGDYALAAEGNIALPLGYYARAISLMRQNLHHPIFFVFSDDLDFAKQNLPEDVERVFVEGNDDFSSHEDLRLMFACHHHIIANSSFSWWGAWLNSRPEKTVIAPRHWHLTPDSYYPDLLPSSWLLLDSLRNG